MSSHINLSSISYARNWYYSKPLIQQDKWTFVRQPLQGLQWERRNYLTFGRNGTPKIWDHICSFSVTYKIKSRYSETCLVWKMSGQAFVHFAQNPAKMRYEWRANFLMSGGNGTHLSQLMTSAQCQWAVRVSVATERLRVGSIERCNSHHLLLSIARRNGCGLILPGTPRLVICGYSVKWWSRLI